MWLAETTRFYLSEKLVLLQEPSGRIQEFSVAPGLSLQDTLAQLPPQSKARARLEVHLSPAFCPAVAMDYPEGMHRFSHKLAFARAACAARLDCAREDLQVELDVSCPGIVAALRRPHWEAIVAWAGRRERLHSVRPLWSLVARACIGRRVQAVALREPDGLSLLGIRAGTTDMRAASVPLQPETAMQPVLNRLHQALSLPDDSSPLYFGLRGTSVPQHRPPCWTPYWTHP